MKNLTKEQVLKALTEKYVDTDVHYGIGLDLASTVMNMCKESVSDKDKPINATCYYWGISHDRQNFHVRYKQHLVFSGHFTKKNTGRTSGYGMHIVYAIKDIQGEFYYGDLANTIANINDAESKREDSLELARTNAKALRKTIEQANPNLNEQELREQLVFLTRHWNECK